MNGRKSHKIKLEFMNASDGNVRTMKRGRKMLPKDMPALYGNEIFNATNFFDFLECFRVFMFEDMAC